MKYMIKKYSKSGNVCGVEYTDTLEKAVEIRKQFIAANKIKRFSYFPTIWELNGTDYKRLLGF